VLKLQADFVHGYRLGAAVFYVSTTNFEGKHREVTAAERDGWNQYWQSRDREFEEFLQRDPLLCDFSNKFFYVWNNNHTSRKQCPNQQKMSKINVSKLTIIDYYLLIRTV
jgi:hypothetical protein